MKRNGKTLLFGKKLSFLKSTPIMKDNVIPSIMEGSHRIRDRKKKPKENKALIMTLDIDEIIMAEMLINFPKMHKAIRENFPSLRRGKVNIFR